MCGFLTVPSFIRNPRNDAFAADALRMMSFKKTSNELAAARGEKSAKNEHEYAVRKIVQKRAKMWCLSKSIYSVTLEFRLVDVRFLDPRLFFVASLHDQLLISLTDHGLMSSLRNPPGIPQLKSVTLDSKVASSKSILHSWFLYHHLNLQYKAILIFEVCL